MLLRQNGSFFLSHVSLVTGDWFFVANDAVNNNISSSTWKKSSQIPKCRNHILDYPFLYKR